MNIIKITDNQVVDFAAEELRKYLMMMRPESQTPFIVRACGEGIKLGLMEDFNLDISDCKDKLLDDIVYIDTKGENGIIAGSNPRSVLLAVYEYLRQNGCRWLFPGIDGEYIPTVENLSDITFRQKADKSFRGQCIEGAVTQENMIDAIDYAPKCGLNSFMLECIIPFYYYNHWYSHIENKYMTPEPVTEQTVLQWKRACEAEIAKRGIMYHDVGHGMITLPFGININIAGEEPDEETKEFLAMIDGKRGFFKGEAVNTNICMSNDKARAIIADFVVDYVARHRIMDYLHMWIADGCNNNCECDKCIQKTTSDWYVILLNEIDEKLKKAGLDTRIVFIAYNDLLWSPTEEKLKNPERFTLLFAPISREYAEGYGVDADMSALVPYERNNLRNPSGMSATLAYLKKWQEIFSGPCFAFEYHFYSVVQYDPGSIAFAKHLFDDVRGMNKHNLRGMIEDRSQRHSFPTGFANYVWSRVMIDDNADFDEIKNDYFSHSFGSNWQKALSYLEKISELFDFDYMMALHSLRKDSPLPTADKALVEGFEKAAKIAREMKSVCEENIVQEYRCMSVSWQVLLWHSEFCALYAETMKYLAMGDKDKTFAARDALIDYITLNEHKVQKHFDVFHFIVLTKRMFNLEKRLDMLD